MTVQDDLDSKPPGQWTQAEVDGLKNKYRRIHQDHFQGVNPNPTHPKDDPNWEYLGVGRWRRKPVEPGRDMRGGNQNGSEEEKKQETPGVQSGTE